MKVCVGVCVAATVPWLRHGTRVAGSADEIVTSVMAFKWDEAKYGLQRNSVPQITEMIVKVSRRRDSGARRVRVRGARATEARVHADVVGPGMAHTRGCCRRWARLRMV